MDLVERDRDARWSVLRPFLSVRDPEQDVVEGLDVGERVVARDVAVVAPPDMDVGPGHPVHQGPGREQPVDPDRRRTAGGRPVRAPARRDRALERARDVLGGDLCRSGRVRDDDDRGLGHAGPPSGISDAAARRAPTATGSRRPDSIASVSRSEIGPSRGSEVAVEHLDAVLPDADVDGLGLGRHVGPHLRAAALGQQLDAQRRAGGHRRHHRPDHHRHVGTTVGQQRDKPATHGRLARGAAYRAWGTRRSPATDRQRLLDRQPEPRCEPADVVDRLDEVGRAEGPRLVVGA